MPPEPHEEKTMLPQNQSAEPNQSLHKTEKRRAKRKAARSVRVLRLLRIFVGSVIVGSLVATYGFKGSLLSSVLTLLMIAFVPDTVAKITQRFFVREMSRQLATSLPLLERDSFLVLLDLAICCLYRRSMTHCQKWWRNSGSG